MDGKKIFVCTTTRFPDGDAGSIYYTNLSKCLSDNPDEILFVGNGSSQYKKVIRDDRTGLDYLSFRSAKNNLLSRAFSHLSIKKRIISFIFKNYDKIEYLVLDGSFSVKQYEKICAFFKKKRPTTKIIIGMLEKYSLDEFDKKTPFVKRMIKNNNEFISKFNDDKPTIVVISSFLEGIFRARGLKCIRVPFIFEASAMVGYEEKRRLTSKNERIRFIYAGSPSKKDMVVTILKGISLLPASERNRIFVDLAGLDQKWLRENGLSTDTWSQLSQTVKVHGRIPRRQVEEMHKRSDYSILVRDETKCFAKAGFPTKVSESLFYCTVPLTNLTSDLSLYLKEGENALIIEDASPESVKETIERAIKYYPILEKMRIKVCATLKESLSVESYKNTIRSFLG